MAVESGKALDFRIDTFRELKMNVALVLEQTGFHAEQVVALSFLERRVFLLEQELASLEIVVRVKLITNCHGHYVKVENIAKRVVRTTNRQHFDKALLS